MTENMINFDFLFARVITEPLHAAILLITEYWVHVESPPMEWFLCISGDVSLTSSSRDAGSQQTLNLEIHTSLAGSASEVTTVWRYRNSIIIIIIIISSSSSITDTAW